MDYERKNWT